jgi:hypothetical protein
MVFDSTAMDVFDQEKCISKLYMDELYSLLLAYPYNVIGPNAKLLRLKTI